MASFKIPITGIVSHKQRVKSLYKRVLKNLQSHIVCRAVYRYNAVLMRQRFEENRCIKNEKVATDLLCKGEEELFQKKHYQVMQWPRSPGGSAFAREVIPPDWVLDYWHPLEKAQYPEYFARREERKKQYVKAWLEKFAANKGGMPPCG